MLSKKLVGLSLVSLAGLAVLVGCGSSDGGDDNASGSGAVSASPATPGAAPALTPAQQKAVDDKCFTSYSQSAGRCNTSAGNDDEAFDACLDPLKNQLKACCTNGGGSATCAAEATKTPDAAKAVDDACFVAYSQAAGRCNTTAAEDNVAFDSCLGPVKDQLTACCQKGGSPSCADDASKTTAQTQVDDTCFIAYAQGAGTCNTAAGNDDAKFTTCLAPVKQQLTTCCANGGSSSCADDAQK